MKTLSQIITLLPLISLAAAAGEGYLVSYTGAECLQANGATEGVETNIAQGNCADVALFTSYQAGVGIPCSTDSTPKLTLFTEEGCTGTAIDAGTLQENGVVGPCTEVLVTTGGSSVSVGAYSASFNCV